MLTNGTPLSWEEILPHVEFIKVSLFLRLLNSEPQIPDIMRM